MGGSFVLVLWTYRSSSRITMLRHAASGHWVRPVLDADPVGYRGGQTDAGYPRSTCTRTRFPSNTAAQSHTGSAPASCSALA